MKQKIETPFTMYDKDVISFKYNDLDNLLVGVGEHGDKEPLMTLIFEDLLAIKYQVPDAGVQGFVEETETNEFLLKSLNYEYWGDKVPRESVKLFQFLEIDDNPIIEIIARSVKFINHFPNDPMSQNI